MSLLIKYVLARRSHVTTATRFLATVQSSDSFRFQSSDWKAIHQFRYIKGKIQVKAFNINAHTFVFLALASMNKLKTYQLGASLAAVPACIFLPEIFDPTVITVMSFSGIATLTLASFIFKNTVGFVYTNQKKPDLVKFAFMDFWGRRQDVEMRIDDVIPIVELPRKPWDDYFTNLQFLNGHAELKLFHKAGGISDHEEFLRVFGSNLE